MHIAVMGAGGIGGYFGGLLARAGNDVSLIARGKHLEAIRKNGLEVHGSKERFKVTVAATDNPKDVGPVELIILGVKTYQNDQAIPALKPMVGEGTALLTLQNGVDGYQELARAVGDRKVLPGAAYIESQIASPGIIQQSGDVVRIVFGEIGGEQTARAQRILETFEKAQIDTEISSDVTKTLWTKFLFISTLAGVTSATRAPMSRLLQYPETRETILSVMREIEALGKAKEIRFDPDVVEKTMEYMETSAKDLQASMHTDLELGKPLELEALNGAAVRMGKELGIPTPVNHFLYTILLPHQGGAS